MQADHHTPGTPQEMAERTVKYIKDRHHSNETPTFTEPPPFEPGVSTSRMHNDGPESPEATYSRDEIDGPLKTAHGATVVEKVEHKEDVITRKRVA